MAAPALAPEQSRFDQQFRQAEPLLPFVQGREAAGVFGIEVDPLGHGQIQRLAPDRIRLQLMPLPAHLAQGRGQAVAVALHTCHPPAEVAQLANLPLQLLPPRRCGAQLLPPLALWSGWLAA